MVEDLNFFVLLWYIIKNWSYNIAIVKLQKNRKCNNFKVRILWKTIWIIEDKDLIKKVLSKESNAVLTFTNKNFFASHYHSLGIGNIDYENNECLWRGLHNSLSEALKKASHNNRLENIMDKHKMILLKNNTFKIPFNVEQYIIAVWSEFCFGNQKGIIDGYTKMREAYLEIIQNSFYNSTINYLPFIGSMSCKIRRYIYKSKYLETDKILKTYVENSTDSSFFLNFAHIFKEYNEKYNVINPNLIDKVILDNAFLSVFVLDFIHMAISESLLTIINSQIHEIDQRKLAKIDGLTQGYLFPWRMRQIPKDYDIFSKNDYVLMNLHSSKLFFSYGPKTCIGTAFYNKFYNHLMQIINPFQLNFSNKETIVRYPDINRPFILSNHIVEISLPRNYLLNNLKSSLHKNIKFYHVHEITFDSILYSYILNEFTKIINTYDNIDGIISAEARGWLFAAPVANKLSLPLYIARKKGKLPGNVIQKEYQKIGYDDMEILEIPNDITGKNLVIIDDGIASGITTQALYDLTIEAGNKVHLICNVIKHTYTKCLFNPEHVNIVTLFDL
jgi:adenine phosphoribosyltransferase